MADPLEDFFRQRLHNHEETPPAGAWQKINEDIKPVKEPKRGILWWMAPLLLLLSVLTAVLVLRFRTPTDQQAVGNKNPGISTETNATDNNLANRTNQLEATTAPTQESGNDNTNSRQNQTQATGNDEGIPEAASNPVTEQSQNTVTNNNGVNSPKTNLSVTGGLALATENNRPKTIKSAEGKPNIRAKNRNGITQNLGTAGQLAIAATGKNGTRSAKPGIIYNTGTETAATTKNAGTANQNNGIDQTTNNNTGNGNESTEPITTGNSETGNNEAEAENDATAKSLAEVITLPDSVALADSLQPDLAVVADTVENLSNAADSVEPAMAKTRFGFYGGTQFSFRRYAPNQTDQVMINQIEGGSKTAPERFKFVAGGLVQRNLTKRLAAEIGAGVLYSKEKLEYETTTPIPASSAASFTSTGMALQPAQQHDAYKSESQLLYSNLRAGLVLTAARFKTADVSVSGGGIMHILTYQKSTTTINDLKTESKNLEPRKLQTGVYAGLRFSRPFSRSMDVAIEPGLNYYFNSWNKQDQPLRIYTHSYNLNLIFYFR